MRLDFDCIEFVKNGFLGAIYDGLEATVDTLAEAVRGYPSSEAALRADAREDRGLIRSGRDPDEVAERRDRLDGELWASAWYDITFTRLRESGWRSADIELAVDRDGFDIDEFAAGRPEDFGFESVPPGDDFTGDRGAQYTRCWTGRHADCFEATFLGSWTVIPRGAKGPYFRETSCFVCSSIRRFPSRIARCTGCLH